MRFRKLPAIREKRVVSSLRDIAPDLADWIIDFSYGDVMARPGLDRRSRQFATIAALTALGNAQPQLKVHIAGARSGRRSMIVRSHLQMRRLRDDFRRPSTRLNVAREAIASR